MFCANVGAAVMALSTARRTSVLGMTVPRRKDTCFDAWRPRKVAAGVLPPPPRGCLVGAGRRSTPHPLDPPPPRVPPRQRGADSPIGIPETLVSPRGGAAGGGGALAPPKN